MDIPTRLKLYKDVLAWFKNDEQYTPHFGVCELLCELTEWETPITFNDISDLFPEWYALKPPFPHGIFWWDSGNREIRIAKLEECIAFTEAKIRRKEAYEAALAILIDKEDYFYVCVLIADCLGISIVAVNALYFPEFFAQRPEQLYRESSLEWWPPLDKESRITALKKAIELCN